ncbi:hypothetical protein MMC32_000640 [Xylographa parallela]|nr:hypothetical protein [Xylographa parallela]
MDEDTLLVVFEVLELELLRDDDDEVELEDGELEELVGTKLVVLEVLKLKLLDDDEENVELVDKVEELVELADDDELGVDGKKVVVGTAVNTICADLNLGRLNYEHNIHLW